MNFNKLNFCLFSNQNLGGGIIVASLKESNDNVPPQVGIVNKLATSYDYQYVTIKFDFIPSYAILNFYLISNQNYKFYGSATIFKNEPPEKWEDYSYYKFGPDWNLSFSDISLKDNILSISQSSSYNYYVQGVVF